MCLHLPGLCFLISNAIGFQVLTLGACACIAQAVHQTHKLSLHSTTNCWPSSSSYPTVLWVSPTMPCFAQKDRKRQGYAFWRQFNEQAKYHIGLPSHVCTPCVCMFTSIKLPQFDSHSCWVVLSMHMYVRLSIAEIDWAVKRQLLENW